MKIFSDIHPDKKRYWHAIGTPGNFSSKNSLMKVLHGGISRNKWRKIKKQNKRLWA